jgi:DNA-3-methyladenine glycosylase
LSTVPFHNLFSVASVFSVVKILSHSFYDRSTLTVARELLGARLVRILDGIRLAGIIIETEAYVGEEDLGCHARSGMTPRNTVMYGPPGHAYVYFTYGMHWMLNAVTERPGFPAAVLIRAIQPVESQEIISTRRQGRDTLGPAKLTQALGIDAALNGVDLGNPATGLWIEAGAPVAEADIITGPRIGLFTVPEPWKSIPWRFRTSSPGPPLSGEGSSS